MKKLKLNAARLQLNKQKIANLTSSDISNIQGGGTPVLQQPSGGPAIWSAGCSDGCSPLGSFFNCTLSKCSADCSAAFCPPTSVSYPTI